MTQTDFDKLSADLREVAKMVPLHWGAIQNNRTDDQINMFDIDNFEDLEREIANLTQSSKDYLRRRWYLWKCAECDEYLFYKNAGVQKNPDRYDKAWDISIYNKFYFDVKGTVVPREMLSRDSDLEAISFDMVKFYYDKQSKGRRFDMQNRLFIVHRSRVSPEREFYLRCAWQTKERVYKHFVENIENVKLFDYKGCKAALIFLVEEVRGKVEAFVPGLEKSIL